MLKVELLAPAGDQESLIAAIQNGADAIYLGGTLFNARAYAKNFDHEQLKWAVEYAHLRDVKIYVTVNTLYKDSEFHDLIDYIDYLYDIQVDALIVQDIGLFDIVKARYEDFEIHMSTQASLMNVQGAKYFESLGASRIVLARENTLKEIQTICQLTSLEVEVFVHGALCICYSGQCLMSSMIGKRSGNRGACAQPCRLQYQLLKDGQLQPSKTPFLLSPKDLMTIDCIGDLIDAGVTSLKVEGRMKRPEYVASVVKAYRHAIDAHLNKKKETFEEDIATMKAMFNRDYTQGYVGKDPYIVKGDYSGNKGEVIGNVTGYIKSKKRVICQLSGSLKQGDSLVFEKIDKGRPVNKIYVNQKLVSQARGGETVEIEFDYPVYEGHIRKTINQDVIHSLKQTYQKEYKTLPIHMTFVAHVDEPAHLTISYQDQTYTVDSSQRVEKAISTPLDHKRIQQQLSKLGGTCFMLNHCHIDIDKEINIPIKILNEMRREAVEQLSKQLSQRQIHFGNKHTIPQLTHQTRTSKQNYHILVQSLEQLEVVCQYPVDMIYYPYQKDSHLAYRLIQDHHIPMALFIPRICKEDELQAIYQSDIYQEVETVVVNDYGSYHLFHDKQRIIGTGLNVYNSYAIAHYQEPILLSLEMSQKDIENLICND